MYLEKILDGILGSPSFDNFSLLDKNPVSGTEKQRVISKPNKAMREVHRRFLELIRFDTIGMTAHSSPLSNVKTHEKNRFFYQTDIKEAYRNVPLEGMVSVLLRHHPEWEKETLKPFLERYCFSPSGGLVTGAPASPKLFDVYAYKFLDEPLIDVWMPLPPNRPRTGRLYTRYRDDLTFSSPEPIPASLRKKIREVIERAGFQVNHRKSTVKDLKKGRIVICGVGLEYREGKSARIFLPGHYLAKLQGMLHLAVKGQIHINPQVIEGMHGVFCSVYGKRGRKRTKDGLLILTKKEQRIENLFLKYRSRSSFR